MDVTGYTDDFLRLVVIPDENLLSDGILTVGVSWPKNTSQAFVDDHNRHCSGSIVRGRIRVRASFRFPASENIPV